MQIVLNEGQVSDVFFNYDHPAYASLYGQSRKAEETPTDAEVRAAIRADAIEFASCYPSDMPKDEMVGWLVNNFMRRR